MAQDLMIQLCEFRAINRNREQFDPRWTLNRALELDQGFQTFFSDPPISWLYETRYTSACSEHVWEKAYHVYYDYWSAHTWNGLRSCRIMLNESICNALAQGFSLHCPIFSGELLCCGQ